MDFKFFYVYYKNKDKLNKNLSLQFVKYMMNILKIRYNFIYDDKLIIRKFNEKTNQWDKLDDENDIYYFLHFDLYNDLLEEIHKLENELVNTENTHEKIKVLSDISINIKNGLNTYDKVKNMIKDINILEKFKSNY